MQKWEYLHLRLSFDPLPKVSQINSNDVPNAKSGPYYIDYLNQLGEQGWEVVAYLFGSDNRGQLLLKRPKQ